MIGETVMLQVQTAAAAKMLRTTDGNLAQFSYRFRCAVERGKQGKLWWNLDVIARAAEIRMTKPIGVAAAMDMAIGRRPII